MVIGAYGSGWIIDDTVHSGGQTTVPASTTMLLFGTGLIGLTCNRRRRVPGDSLLNSNKRNARTNDALAKDRKKPRPLKCKFQEVDFKN
ncbi:MAG: PEP-CTERM sorting domain-containing protein [Proteobacteria bacterium]|nr:PEP-CTERM sorting domain-containing protein [Pseudomonadota bacterium]